MAESNPDKDPAERRSAVDLINRFASFLDVSVFCCLLGLTVLSVIPYGLVDIWWEAVFECLTFAVTAIWILEALFRGRWEVRKLFVLLPLVLITAFAFVQAIPLPGALASLARGHLTAQGTLSIDQYQTLLTARKALALTLFFGLLLLHTSTPRRFRWLIRTVIGLGLASALFAILRQLLQSPDSQAGFGLSFLYYKVGFGQFLSPNLFAYLMEMVFGLLAGLVLGGGIRRNHVLIYLTLAAFVWTALVVSNSRGGILALVVQTVFLLFVSLSWYSARRLSRSDEQQHRLLKFVQASVLLRVLMVVLLVITLVVAVFWMGGERFSNRVSELNIDLTSKVSQVNVEGRSVDAFSRKDIWRSTWQLIKQNPVTGVGFGSFFLAIPEFQKGAGRIKLEQAHNDYLDLAANGGVIAVILAAWFVVLVIRRTQVSFRSKDTFRRAAALGAAAGILSIAAHSFMDFGLQVTGIAVIFLTLVTICVARIPNQSEPGSSS